jgi:hypothetical protein
LIPSLPSKGMRIEVLFEAHTHTCLALLSHCQKSLSSCSIFFTLLSFFFLCFCHPVSFDLLLEMRALEWGRVGNCVWWGCERTNILSAALV